jgi:hypothetical protein
MVLGIYNIKESARAGSRFDAIFLDGSEASGLAAAAARGLHAG